MKRRRFRTELLTGHKGAAVIVPFDPAKEWGSRAVRVASKAYGMRPGHLIRATLNGHAFNGWIGHRWGRFFILVDEDLREVAGVEVGEMVDVAVGPRARTPEEAPRAARRSAARRGHARRGAASRGRSSKAAGK